MSGLSEDRRQLLHIAVGLLAVLLRWLSWWQALVMAGAAIIFNLTALPRLAGPSIYRSTDRGNLLVSGIVLYPIAVLLLLLAFPRRPDIVAAAWAILAFGDGFATLVGRRARTRLPWNAAKSVAGTCAFAAAGAVAAVALAGWTRPAVSPPPSWIFVMLAPLGAAIVAALVETIPVRMDDNLTVPLSAAAVLWACSLVGHDGTRLAAAAMDARWLPALLVNTAFAAAGLAAGTVSRAGAVVGWTIGLAIYLGAGAAGWMLLVATFLAAAVSSRIGLKRKSVQGIAEERGGRRGPGNALANCGLAAAAALIGMTLAEKDRTWLVLVTALTAGGSDTVASEIGKAWGRRTFLVVGLRPVAPGTSGAVSLEGTLAGLVSALALAALAAALGLVEPRFVWVATAGATIGAFVESALGATLEGPGIVNNDLLNFVNTAVASAAAVALASVFTT